MSRQFLKTDHFFCPPEVSAAGLPCYLQPVERYLSINYQTTYVNKQIASSDSLESTFLLRRCVLQQPIF
jgi:hypothetical protein